MKVLRFSEFLNESKLNEGGNSIADARPVEYKELESTYEYIKKKVFPLIGLDGNEDASPIGSFLKKADDQTSGDIDIAIYADKVAGQFGLTLEEVLNFIDEKLKGAGYDTKVAKGFNQVSFGAPINGNFANGTAQVDLMLSSNLDWSKFMYYSPNFRENESKYKGVYRNILLMSIISEFKKEATKLTDSGEIEEYKQYVLRLEGGIYEVGKTLMGKKGLVKTPTILKDQEKFITNTPESVTEIAFGPNIKPSDIMKFEDIWMHFTDKGFIHKNMFEKILQRFKIYILSNKLPVPSEVEEKFPNLF
jgi:hypothetical protein